MAGYGRIGYSRMTQRTCLEASSPSLPGQGCAGDLTQGLETVGNPRLPAMAATEPQTAGVAVASGKDVPRGKADALGQRRCEELTALERWGQLQPQHEAAGGPGHTCPWGEHPLDGPQHLVDVAGERASDPAQVMVVATRGQEVGEGALRQGRTTEREGEFAFQDPLHVAS